MSEKITISSGRTNEEPADGWTLDTGFAAVVYRAGSVATSYSVATGLEEYVQARILAAKDSPQDPLVGHPLLDRLDAAVEKDVALDVSDMSPEMRQRYRDALKDSPQVLLGGIDAELLTALRQIVNSCTSYPTPMSEGHTRMVTAPSRDALVAAHAVLAKADAAKDLPQPNVSAWDCCPYCGGSGHYGDAARRAIDGEVPASKTNLMGSKMLWETDADNAAAGAQAVRDILDGEDSPSPLLGGIADDIRVSLARPYVHQNFASGEPWSMTIVRAILDERERCAKVADWFSDTSMNSNWTEDACSAGYFACREVAEEIRNPKPASAPSQLIADDEQPF